MTGLASRCAALMAGASVAMVLGGDAYAQTQNPQPRGASREELNPAARTKPAPRRANLFSAPVEAPCPLADSAVPFKLAGVDVAGTTLTQNETSPAYSDLIGQTLPVSAICQIRDRLSLILWKQGILARVEVPEQTMSGGRLKLQVIEARIVSVRVLGDIGPAQDKVEEYLERLRGLTPFDLATAQRYLALAGEVPGVAISASLKANPAGRGAVDLDVSVDRQPVGYLAAIQDTGSAALGPWSVIGRVDANSFTKFGERTTLLAYKTFDDEQWVVQLQEEARFGSSGLVGKVSLAYGESRPGSTLKVLGLRGHSFVTTLEASYPLVRTGRRSLWLDGGIDVIDQTTDFASGGNLSDDKLRVVWTDLRGRYEHTFQSDVTLSLSGELEARQGLEGLGSSKAGDLALSRIEGRPDAWLVRLDSEGTVSSRFGDARLRLQAQTTDRPLLGFEEMSAGNLTIGQGYEPAVLSGDKGVMAEIRLRAPAWTFGKSAQVRPFVFYDVSKLKNFDTGSEDRSLRSVGGGVEVYLPRDRSGGLPFGVAAKLLYAAPLDKPFAAAAGNPERRVLFQIVLNR